ncbi:hypothetical protein P872_16050 [Rhodonellum psychrophilum GCM71 = DSM 17998]|uniref:Uncharacterized protein n=1 Tax=Rhodonellum psychrophilum GCM71 = DSM 17998 TaxID=1123057 RepID=U5BS11_9BACT|nr:hypothetical protein P872_16050 [Rhodonellum psychrophilum GCM71 = DSM 17998]
MAQIVRLQKGQLIDPSFRMGQSGKKKHPHKMRMFFNHYPIKILNL